MIVTNETKVRTFTRVIGWRLISLLITFVVLYKMTDDLALAVEASAIAHLIRLVFHFFYERGCLRVRWGLKENGS